MSSTRALRWSGGNHQIRRKSRGQGMQMPPHHERPKPGRDAGVEAPLVIPRVADGAAAEMREDRPALVIRRHVTGPEPPGEARAVARGGEDAAPRVHRQVLPYIIGIRRLKGYMREAPEPGDPVERAERMRQPPRVA